MKFANFKEVMDDQFNNNNVKKDIVVENLADLLEIKLKDLKRVKDLAGYKIEIKAIIDALDNEHLEKLQSEADKVYRDDNEATKILDMTQNTKETTTLCFLEGSCSPVPINALPQIVEKSIQTDPCLFFNIVCNLFHNGIDFFSNIFETILGDDPERLKEHIKKINGIHNSFQEIYLAYLKGINFSEYCRAFIFHKVQEIKDCKDPELREKLKAELADNQTFDFVRGMFVAEEMEKEKILSSKTKKPDVFVIYDGNNTCH